MMMGTKSAGPMRRTTSMTEFAPPDVLASVAEEEAMAVDGEETDRLQVHEEEEEEEEEEEIAYGRIGSGVAAYRARPAAAHRRNSADFSAAAVETAAFLRACGLCNRRLGPGRDTFMYRGDSAFCSLECRQQHIAHEEWKGKCALAAPVVATVEPAAASSVDQPTAGGTLAAA